MQPAGGERENILYKIVTPITLTTTCLSAGRYKMYNIKLLVINTQKICTLIPYIIYLCVSSNNFLNGYLP